MRNCRVKAIALDLDGTVFGGGQLNLEEVKLMRELQHRGVTMILCSGRTLHYVLGVARCLGTEGPLICEEGSVVYDQREHSKMINGDLGDLKMLRRKLNEWLPRCIIPKEAHHDKEVILALDRQPRTNLDSFVKEVSGVILAKGLGLNVTRSDEMVNVMPLGVDKGLGLKKALEILDIDSEEVVAAGDAPNDLPLFRESGYAFAVANANPRIKAAARRVASRPDGEGVIEMMRLVMRGEIP